MPRIRQSGRVAAYLRSRPATLGASVIALLALVALLAPLLTPYDPLRRGGLALLAPRLGHWFGTDDLGRDTFAQVLYGIRISLLIGITSAATAVVIGVLVGSWAGYFGGAIDDVLMRLTELFQVIPRIFLLILMVALLGQTLLVITIAIGVLSWPSTARIVRAEFLSRREAEYVMAARALGASATRIIFRQILPNSLAPVVVNASLLVGGAILLEAGLAFFGLGDQNAISLGQMIYSAFPFMRDAWWASLFPGLFLSLIVVAFNLIGDGLNDALNPRRQSRR